MQFTAPTQNVAYHPDTATIKLILWRSKGRLTVSRLARRADCHPSTISRVITGQIKDGRWIEWLAGQLGVPVSDIAVRSGKKRKAA